MRTYTLRDKSKPLVLFGNGENKWLHNWAKTRPIEWQGITLLSAEAVFQCIKCYNHGDIKRALAMQRIPPIEAMQLGRKANINVDEWLKERVTAMRIALELKFKSDALMNMLMETGTKTIVEYSKRDAFWGAKPIDDNTLQGHNVLGRLLMELREINRNGATS